MSGGKVMLINEIHWGSIHDSSASAPGLAPRVLTFALGWHPIWHVEAANEMEGRTNEHV